ncbi:MAG: hypothetical protein JNK24_03130 [Alphaproteobacteria bacterium]|nr:hypothetical protein [Alphaproteobacteria bacterium]
MVLINRFPRIAMSWVMAAGLTISPVLAGEESGLVTIRPNPITLFAVGVNPFDESDLANHANEAKVQVQTYVAELTEYQIKNGNHGVSLDAKFNFGASEDDVSQARATLNCYPDVKMKDHTVCLLWIFSKTSGNIDDYVVVAMNHMEFKLSDALNYKSMISAQQKVYLALTGQIPPWLKMGR